MLVVASSLGHMPWCVASSVERSSAALSQVPSSHSCAACLCMHVLMLQASGPHGAPSTELGRLEGGGGASAAMVWCGSSKSDLGKCHISLVTYTRLGQVAS